MFAVAKLKTMTVISKPVLRLKKLSKFYGKFKGVEDLDLTIYKGEVFGFLGPNGAGKTTAIRTIMNFLRPTSGSAVVLGYDSVKNTTEVKAKVGYLAGDFEMYDNLTGREYLSFIAHLRKADKPDEQIKQLAAELDAPLDRKISTLSRGNMQKIALISALLHDPDILILDEPTTGLDPLMQNQFYKLVRERTKRGKTVFMSSHILSEVQTICDRVAFMKDGKLVEVVDVNKARRNKKKEVSLKIETGKKISKLPSFKNLEVIKNTKTELRFVTAEPSKTLLKWLAQQPADDISIQSVSLEDMFLNLYGKSGVDHV
jgi:ABC-2 type transport system ATP-binding protein